VLAVVVLPAAAPSLADVLQKSGVRVEVHARLQPTRLPRRGRAPVGVRISGRIAATGSTATPQLESLSIAINRGAVISSRGLPICRVKLIQPSTTREALRLCRRSLIGRGSFTADVELPEQSPFPRRGDVVAFNGRVGGRQAILAHIYGTKPLPASYVLPFLRSSRRGTFRSVFTASLPQVTGDWGFVTGLSLELGRPFEVDGHSRSYLSAGCPAPSGFDGAAFPLVRTTFAFEGNLELSDTLVGNCRVRG
jgi:hypothetical protein